MAGKSNNGTIDPFVEQMVSSMPNLKAWLKSRLTERAKSDFLFAKSFVKPNKSLEGCEKYIIKQMREIAMKHKTGNVGFVSGDDADLINIAVHYYSEDSIEEPKEEQKPKVAPIPTPPRTTLSPAPVVEKKPEAVQLSLF